MSNNTRSAKAMKKAARREEARTEAAARTRRRSRTRALVWVAMLGIGAFIVYGAWAYLQLPDRPGPTGASATSDGRTGLESFGAPAGEGSEPLRIQEAVSQAEGNPDTTVTLQGEVVDMGPTMGCWLLIRDGTGEVLVQTVPIVYMPQELRGATVKATGTLTYGQFRGMNVDREGWYVLSPGVEVVRRAS